jgi:hypothetical protein
LKLEAHRPLDADRAREPDEQLGFRDRLPFICLDEDLLVGDLLGHYITKDVGFNCVNAIAYPRERCYAIMERGLCALAC